MLREDADDCLEMLVSLGRAIPADQWVDDLVEEKQNQEIEQINRNQRQNLDSVF